MALDDDSVDSLIWYHTSRYENWPDLEAYTADVTEQVAQVKGGYGFDGERYLRTKTSLALHLGTYESAIENMLRRLHDQDIGNPNTIRYWLHRVQIRLKPNDRILTSARSSPRSWAMSRCPICMNAALALFGISTSTRPQVRFR
jgi:hypothetical protein